MIVNHYVLHNFSAHNNFSAETFIVAPLLHIIALMRDVSTNYPEAVFSKKPLVGTLNLGLATHKHFCVYW